MWHFLLYEFLSVAGVIQPDDDKEGRGDQHVYPAMENGVEEYLRVLVNGNVVGVQEDIPLADTEAAVHHVKDEPDDDDDHGGPVAVLDGGAQHEGERADKEGGSHCLEGQVHRGDGHDGKVGEYCQDERDDKAENVRDQKTEQPYFVAIVGDAEDDLDNFGILVVLQPEAHRVEDEQDARQHQHLVGGGLRDFVVTQQVHHHGDYKEHEGTQHEVQEFVPEDDLDVVLYQFLYRYPKLNHNRGRFIVL